MLGVHVGLAVDAFQVGVDRALGDEQLAGDFARTVVAVRFDPSLYETEQAHADEFGEDADPAYAYINLGGNAYVIGSKPDGSDWNVGVQDPNGADQQGDGAGADYRGVRDRRAERGGDSLYDDVLGKLRPRGPLPG